MFPICLLLTALIAGQAQPADSPAKPNFSGEWKMVKEKSDFGGFAVPDRIVRTIDHHDPTLNVHTVQTDVRGPHINDVSYFTDGAESDNTISGRDAKSKGFWDGPALVIRTSMKASNGDAVEMEDRWELSDDGKTLTVTSKITTAKGGAILKLVCEKQ